MGVYKQVGIWAYVVLLLLSLAMGALTELFLDKIVFWIFLGTFVLGFIVSLLNLSKNIIVQVSNISLVFMLVGFLGTNLNTLISMGVFLAGFWKALIAFNVPIVLVSCIARLVSLSKDKSEADKKDSKDPWQSH